MCLVLVKWQERIILLLIHNSVTIIITMPGVGSFHAVAQIVQNIWQLFAIRGVHQYIPAAYCSTGVSDLSVDRYGGLYRSWLSDDELTRGQKGAEEQSVFRLETFEEEIFLLSHAFVYHPNLLEVDLGGGFITTQNKQESPAVSREYDDELYSLTAQLRFLKAKPYPVTLFYDRTNPTTNTTEERFVRENERYGVNASLLQPLLPFSVNLTAYRQTNQGTGATQIIDERTDDVFLRAYSSIGDDGHGQLTYHNSRRVAENGFITSDPPTVKTDIRSESTSFDTHFRFGAQRQYTLTNLISYFEQNRLPSQQEFRFNPNLTWEHSDKSASFYRFDYLQSEVDEVETTNKLSTIGGRHQFTDTISGNAELSSENSKTTGVENTTDSVTGTMSYIRPLSFGQLQLSAGTRYAETDRQAGPSGLARRENEPIRLEGIQSVALSNPNVTDVGPVILQNNPGEVLVENVDYVVEYPNNDTPGSDGITYIRRVTGGKIESGQTVRWITPIGPVAAWSLLPSTRTTMPGWNCLNIIRSILIIRIPKTGKRRVFQAFPLIQHKPCAMAAESITRFFTTGCDLVGRPRMRN